METNSNIVVGSISWAIQLPEDEVSAAAVLRLRGDVLACRADGQLWLRGATLDEQLDLTLRRLAPAGRYRCEPDGRLIPIGKLLPAAHLTKGPWTTFKELVVAARTPAALSAHFPGQVPLNIVRSAREQSATLLRTALGAWVSYCETAPLIRLKPLHFAASDREALIRGTPLPPLPGIHYYERSGIVVPCGFGWSPDVDAQTLREVLRLDPDDLALFDEAGGWQRIPTMNLVRATRSSARLTMRGTAR